MAAFWAYFNSIKVQLKQQLGGYYGALTSFQFHKGTIKTIVSVDTTIVKHKFQFHKGTIKTTVLMSTLFTSVYFNSIKVQLKHAQAESFIKAGNTISIP